MFKRTNKYGKIKIKIKSVEDYVPTPGVAYEDALKVAKNMGAESYEFEFNVGRKEISILMQTLLGQLCQMRYII